jgi:hypothetical protein
MEQNKLGILIGLFLLGGIIAWLVLPLSFQDTTIILESGTGGAPVSCLPSGGFVLAQNLTDLCDVTIISPNTDQIIQYNGSQWVNVDSAFITTNATCSNLGSGTIICASDDNNILAFKSLVELNGIDITNSSSEIFIRNTGVLSVNAGSGISVNQTTGNVLITNTLPENTQCNNSTGGIGICIDDTITLRNLVSGSSILVSSNATHITITNTAPDNTACANVGTGTVIYKDGECNFKTLVGSPDISITNTTNTVVIDYNGTHVTSLTSNNNSTIGVVPTTGAVVLYPKYELLCQTTLGSANATISCNGFTAMKHLHVEALLRSTGGTGVEPAIRFNGDSGTNYSNRQSTNGGADTTQTSTTRCNLIAGASLLVDGNGILAEFKIYNNLSSDRKVMVGQHVNGLQTDDTSAPNRGEISCKWDNTSAQITSITVIAFTGTGNYNTSSQLTVWGYD